eukprot:gene9218-12429_t
MRLKFVIAGPKGTGKSLISNYLCGGSETLTPENQAYRPTAGVRIVDFEAQLNGIQDDFHVELWDASGDPKYESCWRGIMDESDGVILVYNPDAPAQDQQISDWFDFFVRKNGLRDEQCLVFAHRGPSNERFRPPPLFSRVTAALTGPQSGPDIKGMFDNFLREVYMIKSRK